MSLKMLIKNGFAYAVIGIVVVISAIGCMIVACLPAKYRYGNRVFFFFANFYYTGVLRALQLPIEIEGTENIPNVPVIFIANHQSVLDIPLVGSIVGKRPHEWLVLSYYLKFPIIGFLIRRMNIAVEQDKSIKAARALIQVLKVARDTTMDLIIFPEGGRYSCIHTFFDGYALIIEKSKRPLVPIYIQNNFKIFPPQSRMFKEYPVAATVGPAFTLASDESYEVFNKRVHAWFLAQQALTGKNCDTKSDE